jgi:hypothetical protein
VCVCVREGHLEGRILDFLVSAHFYESHMDKRFGDCMLGSSFNKYSALAPASVGLFALRREMDI